MFLKKYYFSGVGENDRIRILHMAPEEPLFRLMQRMKNLEIYYGDTDPVRYWFCPDIQFVDLTDIPFESGYFDLVIASHILEHIPNDQLAMKEIRRVLKKGGSAFLQTPVAQKLEETYENTDITTEEDRVKHFGQKDHVRVYGKDYGERLEKAGFEVQITDPSTIMTDEIAFRTCIDKREKIYTASKK
jgi:SAM-dependent methyltransferase